MPAMVACGRRWPIGSDDLVFPGVASLITRVLVISSLVFALIAYRENLSCDDTVEVVTVAFIMLVLAVVIGVLEIFIVVFSARGSIVNPKPRRPVVYLLYFRMAMFCLETVLTIIGTVFAFVDKVNPTSVDPACADLSGPTTALRVVMVLMCLVLLGIILGILSYVDPCRLYRSKVHYADLRFTDETISMSHPVILSDGMEDSWHVYRKQSHSFWEKAFRFVLCGCKGNNQSEYSDIAEIFSRALCDVNVVPSDLAAVFILLQRHQLDEENARRQHWGQIDGRACGRLSSTFSDGTESFDRLVDFRNKDDFDTFEAAQHFMHYAWATYSWAGYLYLGGLCSSCKLAFQILKGGCCFQRKRGHVRKDNCCYCNLHGFRQIARRLDEEDIFYFSLENDVCQVPFFILFDHEKQAVVVVIRGTYSISDVVTDFAGFPEPIPVPIAETGHSTCYAHRGILQTAMWVKEQLYNDRLLEQAFTLEPDYDLVVVGHSLGGGCAAVLSLLLKDKYKDLKCYTYGTPGYLLDINTALYTQSFITTVTIGKDLIARLGVYTGYVLKRDLLKLVTAYDDKPKYRILLEGLVETVSRLVGKDYSFPVKPIIFDDSFGQVENFDGWSTPQLIRRQNEDFQPTMSSNGSSDIYVTEQLDSMQRDPTTTPDLHSSEEDSNAEERPPNVEDSDDDSEVSYRRPLLAGHNEESHIGSPSGHQVANNVRHRMPLYPPGRVIHLREVRTRGQCCLSKRRFEAHWVDNENFQRIVVSPDMVRDHLPETINKAVEYVWETQAADSRALSM